MRTLKLRVKTRSSLKCYKLYAGETIAIYVVNLRDMIEE